MIQKYLMIPYVIELTNTMQTCNSVFGVNSY